MTTATATPRRICIVGTGQAGTYLAVRLREAGHTVTLVGGRTPEEIRSGPPEISQMSFPLVRAMEERAGLLSFEWRSQAPELTGVHMSLRPDGTDPMVIAAPFSTGTALSVDRAVKIADWLAFYGDVDAQRPVMAGMTVDDLDFMTRRKMFDLVVVATGDGELARLFTPHAERSAGARRRVFSQVFLHDVEWPFDVLTPISTPRGECFLIPVLRPEGRVMSVMLAGRPESAFDCSREQDRVHPPRTAAIWTRIREVLSAHLPDVAHACRGAEPVAGRSAVIRRVNPEVRHGAATLPSGGHVLGVADVVMTSDPSSAQGWGNSTRGAETVFAAIQARGGEPFDKAWMEEASEAFWRMAGRYAASFSNMIFRFWDGSLAPHIIELAMRAASDPVLAQLWIDCLDDPALFRFWLYDATATTALLTALDDEAVYAACLSEPADTRALLASL